MSGFEQPCPDCGVPKHPARICPCTGYYEKLDAVARNLYSLEPHYCRWEDARIEVKQRMIQKAHLARIWWKIELGHNQFSEDPVPKTD